MHSNRSWWVHRRPLHHPPCLPLRIKTCGNFFAQHPLRNHHVGDFSSTQRVHISFPILKSGHYLVETCDCRIWLEVQNCESQPGWSVIQYGMVSLVDQYSLKEPSCHWTGDSIPFQAIGQTDQIGSLMKTHNHDQEITVFDDYIPVKSKYVYFYPISCAQRSEGWVKCRIKVKRLCTTHPRKLSTFEWFCISSALPPNLHRKVCQKFACSMFNLVGFVWSFLIVFW